MVVNCSKRIHVLRYTSELKESRTMSHPGIDFLSVQLFKIALKNDYIDM